MMEYQHHPLSIPYGFQQQMVYPPFTAPPPQTHRTDAASPIPLKPPNNQPESSDMGELSCATCQKVYRRPCDLTKHIKTHTRPHKCPVAECKYSTLGWATEKECERHINDKHNPNPELIRCTYCGYTTKRLSNVKQHMEKTHKIPYHRSKGPASKKRVVVRRPATKSMSTASTRSATTKSTATESTIGNDYESITAATDMSLEDMMDKPLPMSDKPSYSGLYCDLLPTLDITSHTAGWSDVTDMGPTIDTSVAHFDSDLAQVEQLSAVDGPVTIPSVPVCVPWTSRSFRPMDQSNSAVSHPHVSTGNDFYKLETPLTFSQQDEYVQGQDAALSYTNYEGNLYAPSVAFSYFSESDNYYVPDTHLPNSQV